MKGQDQWEVLRPHCLQSLCEEEGGINIGRRNGSGIPEGRVGGGRGAVWEASVCIEHIVAKGEVDGSDPTGTVEVQAAGF